MASESPNPYESRPASKQPSAHDGPTRVRWIVFALGCSTSWMLYLHRYTFALIKPATRTRLDVGLNLKGEATTSRLQAAGSLGIPVREATLGRVDLLRAQEAFLTGTGAGVVGIRSLDGVEISVERPVCEKLARAYVAELSTPETRGSAMGWYQAVVGALALAASLIAGGLWTAYGPAAPFAFGAATAAVAALLFPWLCRTPAVEEPAG